MQLEQIAHILTSLAMILTSLTPLIIWIANIQRKAAKNTVSINTMWNGMLRRGAVEAEIKGLVTKVNVHSPEFNFLIQPEVRAAYNPIAPSLRRLYIDSCKKQKNLSEAELAQLIEQNFGPWLVRHICEPLGVHDMACIRMAIDIAKQPGPIVFHPEELKSEYLSPGETK